MNRAFKTFLLPAGALIGAAAIAGCNAGAADQTALIGASASNMETAPAGAIARSEGVPNGVKTASGLTVPRGFKVEILAQGLFVPRRLAIAPGASPQKYDLFVSESKANRVSVLRVKNGRVERKSTFSERFNQPYGLAFLNDSLYVGNTDAVVRLPYKIGALSSPGAPRKVAGLTSGGYNQHWTRNLLVAPGGKKLFVTVGSSCNTCEEDDPQRAAISEMNADGSGKKLFASGLRNPVGVAIRPGTSELWTVVNERDNLGDDTPPDYLTRVQKGGFYGWPNAYTGLDRKVSPDPTFGDDAAKVAQTIAADVPVQAHSAALGVAFYPLQGGNFPPNYRGDAFLSFHGSWNRSAKTGYKIVRVNFEKGRPKAVTDFVTGTLNADGGPWGRPVDVQIAPDGSMLFSDDGNGKIWRVSWVGTRVSSQMGAKRAGES